jgi:GNAT superfamily N-acetyltransferase
MIPSQVNVRRVDEQRPADVDSLVSLWMSWARSRTPARTSARTDLGHQLRVALRREGVEAFLARAGGRDVGFVVLSRGLLPLLEEPTVSIEHLYVEPEGRRRGAGRALIARVANVADKHGAERISTSVPSSGREGQRFFARLGFSPFVVRRVATVSALRRRLVAESSPALDITVLRRRSLRARTRALGVLPR